MYMRGNRISDWAAIAACWGMLVSNWNPPVTAEEPSPTALAGNDIRDVSLNEQGVLIGQILDGRGGGVAGVPIHMQQDQTRVMSSETDASGRFLVGSLRGGVYQLTVGRQQYVIRVWTHGTAPPSATMGFQAQDGLVSRGQSCTDAGCTEPGCAPGGFGGGLMGFVCNPFVIGAAIAAAIAIPLALDDDDDSSS